MSKATPTPIEELTAAKGEITTLKATVSERDATITELTGKVTEANGAATKATTDLAEANRKLGEAEARATKAEADLKVEKASHDLLKTNFDAEVTKQASAKAAQIAASQGIPPGKTPVGDKPGQTDPRAGRAGKSYLELLASGARRDLEKITVTETE